MSICKVKKINILTYIGWKDEILEELQKAGCVQIKNVTSKLERYNLINFQNSTFSDIDTVLAEVKFCIEYLSNYKREVKNHKDILEHTKKVYKYDELITIYSQFDYQDLYRQCKELDNKLNELRTRENYLKSIIEQVKDFSGLEVKLTELEGTKNTSFIIGFIPVKDYISCAGEIFQLGKGVDLVKFGEEDKRRQRLFIIVLKENLPSLKKILNKYNFEYLKLSRELNAKPSEVIQNAKIELENLTKRRKDLIANSIKLYKNILPLYITFDHLFISKSKKEAEKYFKQTNQVLILEGWILEKDIERLKKRLLERFQEIEIFLSEPEKDEVIPTALNNHQIVKPFEVITELYGIPQYHEIDPTPLLSPFFFIFFGICLSDAGYGLIMAAVFYFAGKKLKISGMMKKLFNLLIMGGLSSFIVGLFMGSWLGNTLDYLPKQFSFLREMLVDRLALINPVNDPIPILILSLLLGIIQIYTGIITKFVDNVRNNKTKDGLMDQGCWLLLITSILIFGIFNYFSLPQAVITISKFMIISGVLLIILTQGRSNKNFIKRIGSGILSLYDITGYLSDVLSYSRLFALGLATGIIAVVVNTLVELVKGIPYVGFILVIIIYFGGHIFNIAISALSAFIHSARLQYVEFFTKFYQGGGSSFHPLKIDTKYINVQTKE